MPSIRASLNTQYSNAVKSLEEDYDVSNNNNNNNWKIDAIDETGTAPTDRESVSSKASTLTSLTSSTRSSGIIGGINVGKFNIGRRASCRRSDNHGIDKEIQKRIITAKTSAEIKMETSNAVRDMTVNKLRFRELGLVGRDKETALLNERLECLVSPDNTQRELILIKGYSGTGKSALANTLQPKADKLGGLLIRGKFDLNMRDQPYVTVIAACMDLCKSILNLPLERQSAIKEAIEKALSGMEMQQLAIAVPLMKQLFAEKNFSTNNISANNATEQKSLLENAFRAFVRIGSSHFAPLVMVLDDMQWADVGTLELFKRFLADKGNTNLMIVGCYRSDEVEETHIFAMAIREIIQQASEYQVHVEDIEIGNLDETATTEILSKLLDVEDKNRLKGLNDVCYKRTLGNAFFFLGFIETLNAEKMLEFNLGTFSWHWNISEIYEKTAARSNVVDLMKDKINRSASPAMIEMLKLCCCLGADINVPLLNLIWDNFPTEDNVIELLNEAVEAGFLEVTGSEEVYRWIHDKVQEAAQALESPIDFTKRQHAMGKILLEKLSQDDLEKSLFVVVNLLNNGAERSVDLAELNLRAANKAKMLSAFDSQSVYAAKGISNLPEGDLWKTNKNLAVDLYSCAADAADNLGDITSMEGYSATVLSQDSLSILEKLPCYKTKMSSMSRTGKQREGLELGIDVLEKLGCVFPKMSDLGAEIGRFLGVLAEHTITQDEVNALPLMTDPYQLEIMFMIEGIMPMSYRILDYKPLWVLLVIRGFELTIEHGLAEESPIFFSCTACFLNGMGHDVQALKHINDLSLSMHKRLKRNRVESGTLCVACGMVRVWVEPMQFQKRQLLEGYKKGLEQGECTYAFINIVFFFEIAVVTGQNLSDLARELAIYQPQMAALNGSLQLEYVMRVFWQLALNLMGKSPDPMMSPGIALGGIQDEPGTSSAYYPVILQHFLYVYLGDHEAGAKSALERGAGEDANPGIAISQVDPFFRGISLYAMARKTKKKKYKVEAKKAKAKVDLWMERGFVNQAHRAKLLEAENAAVSRKIKSRKERDGVVRVLYQEAIQMAVRSGHQHDAGLARERLADYLERRKDFGGAAFEIQEAIVNYEAYGATVKVDQLRSRHIDLLARESGLDDISAASGSSRGSIWSIGSNHRGSSASMSTGGRSSVFSLFGGSK